MVGVTAGNEKIYDAMWGTKIVHTAVHTTVHTGVHTQHGSPCFYGVFLRIFKSRKGWKYKKNQPIFNVLALNIG